MRGRQRIERGALLAGLGALGAAASLWLAKRAAATPVKLTLPWLPLGTYSFAFVARRLSYFAKRGLVTIDRGFGSTQVCVRRSGAIRLRPARSGGHGRLRRQRLGFDGRHRRHVSP